MLTMSACPSCGHENELPYLFCGRCGAPRLKPGRWLIIIDLWLAMVVFLGLFWLRNNPVLKDFVLWDWPVFLLYGFFLFQFSLPLVAGIGARGAGTVLGWLLVAMLGALAFLEITNRFGAGAWFQVFTDLPDLAREAPLTFYGALSGVLAAVFVPALLRWRRAFGWIMAYRLVLLALLALSLCVPAMLALTAWLHARHALPDLDYVLRPLLQVSRPKYDHALLLAALMIVRILVLEICLYASISGYGAARHYGQFAPIELHAENGFVRSMLMLAHSVRRVGHTLEQMARVLIATALELSRDLFAVARVFGREVLLALLALIALCAALGVLVRLTRVYIDDNQPLVFGRILLALAGVMAGEIVFMGCKTRLRWRRIVAFFLQLAGWLLPNLLVFFLLLSLSLYASSAAVNHFWELPQELPFKIGWLTCAVGAILAGLLAIVFIRKGSLLKASAPGAGRTHGPAQRQAATPQPEPETSAAPKAPGGFARLLQWGPKTVERWLQPKPYLAEQLESVQSRFQAKLAQLEALERNKGKILPEIYTQLRAQYRVELESLDEERGQLQFKVEQKYSSKLKEIGVLEGKLNMLNRQIRELEQLAQSGALHETERKRQARPIQAEIEKLTAQLTAHRDFIHNIPGPDTEAESAAEAKE